MAEHVAVLGLGYVGLAQAANRPEAGARDAVIVAVAHRKFVEMAAEAIRGLGKPEALLYDIKGIPGRSGADTRP